MKTILENWKKFYQEDPNPTEREKKDKAFPGYDELRKLGIGIISEEEEESKDDKVMISKDALERLVFETLIELANELDEVLEENPSSLAMKTQCKKHGFYSLQTLLNFINNINSAEKGKLHK